MLTFNEGKVCDAMVRRLEEREGQKRAKLRWPERENWKAVRAYHERAQEFARQ
jgi:hypothetical protein